MNTIKRGAKKQDVIDSVSKCWNENLEKCIKDNGYTRESFAAEYKRRYGTGNPTDVYRWMNVGNPYGQARKRIGFPSYDTMKRIADFFGVTVGYLTGETDYKTFEMERACTYLGIDELAGKAIRSITCCVNPDLKTYALLQKENTFALRYLLTAKSFRSFLDHLCNYAASIDRKQHPTNHLEEVRGKLAPELFELALENSGCCFELDPEGASEATPELIEAIEQVDEAISKNWQEEFKLEREEKLAKYLLYEEYVHLIDEVVCDAHMEGLVGIANQPVSSIEELKKMIAKQWKDENKKD